MEIMISNKAKDFFKSDFKIPEGHGIKIKAQLYGSTNVHTYFSVAIEVAKPKDPVVSVEEDGLLVFVDKSEEWFINGLDLEIDFDEKENIPTYYFMADDDRILDNSDYQQNYPPQHGR